jgi:hypothetical protein
LQEVLGSLNDSAIGVVLVNDLVGSSSASKFAAWSSAQTQAKLPELHAAWQDFDRTAAFWPAQRRKAD